MSDAYFDIVEDMIKKVKIVNDKDPLELTSIENMEVRMNKYLEKYEKKLFGTIYYEKEGTKYRARYKFGKTHPIEDKLFRESQFMREFSFIKTALIFGDVASIKINGKFIKEGDVNDYGI